MRKFGILKDGNRPLRGRKYRGEHSWADFPADFSLSTEENLTNDEVEKLRGQEEVVHVFEQSMLSIPSHGEVMESVPLHGVGNERLLDDVMGNRRTNRGKNITIGIVDEGISGHDCFRGVNIQPRYMSGLDEEFEPSELSGHGNHCLSLMIGREVDGTGVGVASGVENVVAATLEGGEVFSKSLIEGIAHCIQRGAHVISISAGLDITLHVRQLRAAGYPLRASVSIAAKAHFETASAISELIYALRKTRIATGQPDFVILAASGNDSERRSGVFRKRSVLHSRHPAQSQQVVSVGAIDATSNEQLRVADFSNSNVDFVAPGIEVFGAANKNGYSKMSGTSSACPLVAGIFAAWMDVYVEKFQRFPSREQLFAEVLQSAKDNPANQKLVGGYSDVGNGIPHLP